MKKYLGLLIFFVIFLTGCGSNISLTGAETGSSTGVTADHSPVNWDDIEQYCWKGLTVSLPENGGDAFRAYLFDHGADYVNDSDPDLIVTMLGKWVVVKNKAGFPVLCGETPTEAIGNVKRLADAKREVYGERINNTQLPKIQYIPQYTAEEYYRLVRGASLPFNQKTINELKALSDMKKDIPVLIADDSEIEKSDKKLAVIEGYNTINETFHEAWNKARPWERMLFLQTTKPRQIHGIYVMGMKADASKGGAFTTKIPGCTGFKTEPEIHLRNYGKELLPRPASEVTTMLGHELYNRLGYYLRN